MSDAKKKKIAAVAAAAAAAAAAPPPTEEDEAVLEVPKGKKKKDKKEKKAAAPEPVPEPEPEPEAAAEVVDDQPDEKEEKADAEDADDDAEALPDLLTAKKKKKKKVVAADEAAAETKTAAAGHAPWEGSDRDYAYTEMLERVFALLRERNPNLAERKRYVMPPPQLVRVGTRKTMWANFEQICQTMRRNAEHVMSFVLAELGTEGAIDGSQRLVIKGRYVPKQIESLLKKYIVEYVTCHMCRNPETTLTRDPVTRLYFLQCESCTSRRSVAPIKSGFHATNRSDRRRDKAAP